MKFLGIKQAAALLGVSISTLRNWDKIGYLKPSRTEGDHRRYSEEDLRSFYTNRKSIEPTHSCWEINRLNKLSEIHLEKGLNESDAKACGAFTKAQIGALLINHRLLPDEHFDLDDFFDAAKEWSAPYLFETRIMSNSNSLIDYKRIREGSICQESEDVVCCTCVNPEEEFDFYNTSRKDFHKIAKQQDQNMIYDIIYNAKFKLDMDLLNIENAIQSSFEFINIDTNTCEPKIVIYSPECVAPNNYENLTTNLKRISENRFISRLVPENKIIIGTKSQDKFSGYGFCPYLLTCYDAERKRNLSVVGRKLYREGSSHYAVITIR